jgi:septum formation protein
MAVAIGTEVRSQVVRVPVRFRTLDEPTIAAYVNTGEPMDKAGAYGIQGYGATIVEHVDGDFFAVMGLSLVTIVQLAAAMGVTYDFGPLRRG